MLHIIAGLYKNRKIKSPKGQETRPTTSKLREAIFNISQSYIEDVSFLDVFAGSGAMGLEALSRGAKKSVFIDGGKEAIRCIHENINNLGLESKAQVWQGDALVLLKRLQKLNQSFQIIFMDPPYGIDNLPNQLIACIDESSLLADGGMLFIEENKVALIDKERWHTLRLKSERTLGRSQLLQFEKVVSHGQ